MKRVLLSLILLTVSTSAASAQQDVTPLVDHHTHIVSVNASALNVESLLPVIALPEDLDLLLRNKERWGGRDKDVAALTDLYTRDALVLDPVSSSWLPADR
ncbi:MAG: hypothetical protein WAL47_01655 [Pyrinomonadaceae bacterium]